MGAQSMFIRALLLLVTRFWTLDFCALHGEPTTDNQKNLLPYILFPHMALRTPPVSGEFTCTRRTSAYGQFVIQERENAPVEQTSEQRKI